MTKTTKVAIEAATTAAKFLEPLVNKKQLVTIKDVAMTADIVTESDVKVENLIQGIIQRRFPDHGILSEETSNDIDPKKHKHLWIVDPIDGTIAFAAGLPFWSISISYFVDQKPVSSALYLASTKEVLWAETGSGAFVGKRRLFVQNLPWKDSVIAFDAGNHKRKIAMKKLAPNLALGVRFLHMTSGEAGNLGLVARGNLQALVCVHPRIWDFAAGLHLVEEAGGIVTDFRGKPYYWFSRAGHIASAPSIAPEIINHTQKIANYFLQ